MRCDILNKMPFTHTQQQRHETFKDNKYDCDVVYVTTVHIKTKYSCGFRKRQPQNVDRHNCVATAIQRLYINISSPLFSQCEQEGAP